MLRLFANSGPDPHVLPSPFKGGISVGSGRLALGLLVLLLVLAAPCSQACFLSTWGRSRKFKSRKLTGTYNSAHQRTPQEPWGLPLWEKHGKTLKTYCILG